MLMSFAFSRSSRYRSSLSRADASARLSSATLACTCCTTIDDTTTPNLRSNHPASGSPMLCTRSIRRAPAERTIENSFSRGVNFTSVSSILSVIAAIACALADFVPIISCNCAPSFRNSSRYSSPFAHIPAAASISFVFLNLRKSVIIP